MDYKSLETHFAPFLSHRMARRKLRSFWAGSLPEHVKPHPDPIELAPGMPNEGLFPLESMHLNVVRDPFQHLGYTKKSKKLHAGVPETDPDFCEREFVKDKVDSGSVVDVWRYEPDCQSALPLAAALQYTSTEGHPQLLGFCRDLVARLNPPAYDEWGVIMNNGSGDGLFKVFETLCDENTTALFEEFTFTPTISNAEATGASVVPIKVNLTNDPETQGIDVEYLRNLLENWQSGPYAHLNKPKLLYTIATGQNPTGRTLSQNKRREIYALAERHDLLIIEDDPYGYLKLAPYRSEDPLYNAYKQGEYSAQDYCDKVLAKSFVTIDHSGRVVRLETFSKMFAPGLRLGFIVANKFLLRNFLELSEVTTRAPSGVSQAVVANVINAWAKNYATPQDAWINWLMKVAGEYTHRRNVLFQALYDTDAYRKGLFTVLGPSAGMFACVVINFEKFDKVTTETRTKASTELNYKLREEGVRVVLGSDMAVNPELSFERSSFLRITFAHAKDDEELIEAAKRLGKGIERLYDEF
ncbi:LAMI_0B00804g1_1 [Lachancea mirantina]|uniref:LAMI_0B00804g1_1 n=1 Tax=Lachancea mirantina TaxID=1230905 RepID=A0A1G4ITA7_9SACH|nr:LAMI_0B00804g1_1 [Lachancea mirantina]